MAVEDDDVRVFERVTFDGNWPKAAAIDTAVTYSYLMIEEHRRRIERQVAGRQPILSQDFTVVTSVFLDVLRQHGYTIVLEEDQNQLSKKIEELIQRSANISQQNTRQRDIIDQREEELDRLQATIREKDIEIRLLEEQIDVRHETDDLFQLSSCTKPNPYSPATGNPCTLHESSEALHRYTTSNGELKEWWQTGEGLTEEQARQLKGIQQTEQLFSISLCTEPNPYNPWDGRPCIEHEHQLGLHFSNSEDPGLTPHDRWKPVEGLSEEQARQLKTRPA